MFPFILKKVDRLREKGNKRVASELCECILIPLQEAAAHPVSPTRFEVLPSRTALSVFLPGPSSPAHPSVSHVTECIGIFSQHFLTTKIKSPASLSASLSLAHTLRKETEALMTVSRAALYHRLPAHQ